MWLRFVCAIFRIVGRLWVRCCGVILSVLSGVCGLWSRLCVRMRMCVGVIVILRFVFGLRVLLINLRVLLLILRLI